MWLLLLQVWFACFVIASVHAEFLERRLFKLTGITKPEYKEICRQVLPQAANLSWFGKWFLVFLFSPFEVVVIVFRTLFVSKSNVQLLASTLFRRLPSNHKHYAALRNVSLGI